VTWAVKLHNHCLYCSEIGVPLQETTMFGLRAVSIATLLFNVVGVWSQNSTDVDIEAGILALGYPPCSVSSVPIG
jgi:hypothetical protein